ncbi:DUF1993 family protein [Erythrobacter sp. YT30]|uniref:DUF1993 domain-containing protein n=1 Tax=Erythrobacter sp. YT30 TaxID=1735012 RepID=UPI00076DEBF9|nr:DUF1993 domain-containing protein [Erythrobacter sp. YT30]KWV90821.1 hypothetical protein AUC45_05600 [Erythrobacter sp. YT30]
MPITLHQAIIPSFRQVLGGVRAQVDKAESFVTEKGIAAAELIEAKLADDMWPLPYHMRSCWVHSKLAFDLAPTGEFSPDFTDLPQDWDAMRAMIDDAQQALDQVSPDTLEEIAGEKIAFVLGGKALMHFTVSEFLLSFSQPNFYFHATTFYDILRMKGVPLVKRDYLHAPRVIGS